MHRIGAQTRIDGRVQGEGDLSVLGTLSGELELEGTLILEVSGTLEGRSSSQGARVAGTCDGTLQASERLHLERTAKVTGDLLSPSMSVEGGAVIRGRADIALEGAPREASARREEPRRVSNAPVRGQPEPRLIGRTSRRADTGAMAQQRLDVEAPSTEQLAQVAAARKKVRDEA